MNVSSIMTKIPKLEEKMVDKTTMPNFMYIYIYQSVHTYTPVKDDVTLAKIYNICNNTVLPFANMWSYIYILYFNLSKNIQFVAFRILDFFIEKENK